MKQISMCLLAAFYLASYADAQVPEVIRNDLTVSNAYKTQTNSDSIYYFQGHDGDYDFELWRSNGTPEGTYRVENLNPGGPSYPGELTMVDSLLFFMATDENGPEQLYKTDGTAEGTRWIFDVDPEAQEQYHMLTPAGGLLYFRTSRPLIFTELWVSDGSTENTHMVDDICGDIWISYPHELIDFNGSLVFIAADCTTGDETLYITSGLDGSVSQIGGQLVSELMSTGDRLFFSSFFEDYGSELGASAGSSFDVTRASDINIGAGSSSIFHLTEVDSKLFFRAYEPDHGAELWSYDLSTSSIQFVKDINPGAENSSFPSELISFKGKLYFNATDGVHGQEIWVSDGTAEGTVMLKNINEEPADVPYHSYPGRFFATEELLFFKADDGIHGPELWQTDGTAEGTKMTADIWPRGYEGSDPGGFAEIGDYLVFNAWYNKRTLFRLKIHNAAVGIKDHLSESSLYSLYPNPSNSLINIASHSASGFKYQILDLTGRELMNGVVFDDQVIQLDLPFGPGIYLFYAETDHTSYTSKFIIR
jgi:ELWxxDGT repeat protein